MQPALVVVHCHGSLTGADDVPLRDYRHVCGAYCVPEEGGLVALIAAPARNPIVKDLTESGVHLLASGGSGLGAGRPIVPVVVCAAIADGKSPFAGQLSPMSASRPPTFPRVHTWPINELGFSLLSEIRALMASVKAYSSVRFIPKPAAHFLDISLLLPTSVINMKIRNYRILPGFDFAIFLHCL